VRDSIAAKQLTFAEDRRELGFPTHAFPYTAGLVGGALGGVAMVIPAVIYGFLSGDGVWYPVNLVAATLMREMQGMPHQQLVAINPSALVLGLAIHMTVASTIGLLFALLLPTLPGRPVI
jgi:hypothetical protein